ncbi:hypothetical protein HQ544_01355 [Candidatus Falkowbacteria bacterium]|nr:hypothetical protein [Candidatus Falkowbacteria bacterium]
MKLNLKTTSSAYNLLRQAGYSIFRDPNTQETSYTRRLASGFYPRFHIYVNQEDPQGLILNLHLDQKKASYEGQKAHSGEYDSDLVKQEAERIQTFANHQEQKSEAEPKKKGFWSRLFKK